MRKSLVVFWWYDHTQSWLRKIGQDLQDYQDFILHNRVNLVNPVDFSGDFQSISSYHGLMRRYLANLQKEEI